MKSTVKNRWAFFRIVGFACKRSLLSQHPPRSVDLFALAPIFARPECEKSSSLVRERLPRRLTAPRIFFFFFKANAHYIFYFIPSRYNEQSSFTSYDRRNTLLMLSKRIISNTPVFLRTTTMIKSPHRFFFLCLFTLQ